MVQITVTPSNTAWSAADMKRFEELLPTNRPDLVERAKRPIDWDKVNAEAAQESRDAKVAMLLQRLPLRYRDAVPHTSDARNWMASYYGGKPTNLILSGEVNTGKTWEAAGITRSLLSAFIPVTFMDVPAICDSIKPGRDMASLESYQLTPVLVLDDLGVERLTEWVQDQLYQLINFRHNNFLPMIVTTNLNKEAIRERYGARLERRLTESALWVDLVGEVS